MSNSRHMSRNLPILFHADKDYLMAKVEIFREPDKVLIQIEALGDAGQRLSEFLEQADPFALSFGAIPVQNIREKREKN